MNGLSAPRKSEWLSPANMLALLGMLGMAFSSYMTFQTDTRDRVASIDFRLAASEHTIASLQAARDDQAKVNNDMALRLDRLERRR